MKNRILSSLSAAGAALVVLAQFTTVHAADAGAAPVDFNIAAQPMSEALTALGQQSGLTIIVETKVSAGLTANALTGSYTPDEALKRILAPAGLRAEYLDNKTIVVRSAKEPTARLNSADLNQSGVSQSDSLRLSQETSSMQRVSQDTSNDSRSESKIDCSDPKNKTHPDCQLTEIDLQVSIPEILVKGQRSINADIRRTQDSIQPYTIFDREQIARSGAANLEAFFTTRLPMNTQSALANQSASPSVAGRINLRGLGPNQTLILVDGRRIPGVATGDDLTQGSINGISMSSIERIEVLPATASGIYGGSATGGVINVILKRDYSGIDLQAGYENTSDWVAGTTDLSAHGGSSLEDGRTRLTFSVATRDAESLDLHDRTEVFRRGRDLLLANNPTSVTGPLPIGYTANLCATATVSSTTCSPTALVLDSGISLGSNRTFVPVGYFGPYALPGANDGGAAFLANAGAHNTDVTGSQPRRAESSESVSFNVRREFASRVDAFLDAYRDIASSASATNRVLNVNLPATSPYNPFQQNIVVSTIGPAFQNLGELKTLSARGGVIARLAFDWSASLEYGWSKSSAIIDLPNANATLTPAGLAYLQSIALRDFNRLPPENYASLFTTTKTISTSNNIAREISLRFGGPIFQLPAGPVALSGLVEHRKGHVEDAFSYVFGVPSGALAFITWQPAKFQDINSGYFELSAPLVSNSNARSWVRELEITAAIRRDEYETRVVGSTFVVSSTGALPPATYTTAAVESNDYIVGLRYAPAQDIAFRASFGTGFLPPSLIQLVPVATTFDAVTLATGNVIDPLRGNTLVPGPVNGLMSGNSNLKPEQSESLALGMIFKPRFLEGLRFSVDYVQIDKAGEIGRPNLADLIANPASYPGRVQRGPLTATDTTLGYTGGPVTFIDRTLFNLATTTVAAYDFQFDFHLETARQGDWRFYAAGTHQTRRENRATSGSPPIDTVGFSGGPLDWRGNFGVDWKNGPWSVGWNLQYYADYRVCNADLTPAQCRTAFEISQGSSIIPSQTYHDLYFTRRFDDNSPKWSWLSGTEISFSLQNVLNDLPPPIAIAGGSYSSYGDLLLRRFNLSARKHFGK